MRKRKRPTAAAVGHLSTLPREEVIRMFYKCYSKPSKVEKLLGITVVEIDMIKCIIHLTSPYQLLNSMLNKKRKNTSCEVE